MNSLSVWIKNIVYILFIASLLEMLLAQGNTRRFVRVVLGLLLTLMILNPILALVSEETFLARRLETLSYDLSADAAAEQSLARGEALANSNQAWIDQEFLARVERQSEEYALTVAGVSQAEARAELEGEGTGRIARLHLTIRPGPGGERAVGVVQPVVIPAETKQSGSDPEEGLTPAEAERLRQELKETLHNFYGLHPDRVMISFTE